jgi:hypothetical protein
MTSCNVCSGLQFLLREHVFALDVTTRASCYVTIPNDEDGDAEHL